MSNTPSTVEQENKAKLFVSPLVRNRGNSTVVGAEPKKLNQNIPQMQATLVNEVKTEEAPIEVLNLDYAKQQEIDSVPKVALLNKKAEIEKNIADVTNRLQQIQAAFEQNKQTLIALQGQKQVIEGFLNE